MKDIWRLKIGRPTYTICLLDYEKKTFDRVSHEPLTQCLIMLTEKTYRSSDTCNENIYDISQDGRHCGCRLVSAPVGFAVSCSDSVLRLSKNN